MTLPDWPYWKDRRTAALWQAVCLTFNKEPPQVSRSSGQTYQGHLTAGTERKRLEIAMDHARGLETCGALGIKGNPPQTLNEAEDVDVVLPIFAAWAISKGWSLPEGFPRPIDPIPTYDLDAKPFGTRERRTLLTIIAALARNANIDLTKPSKAASIIAKMTDDCGYSVAPETIANHLKRISKEFGGKS